MRITTLLVLLLSLSAQSSTFRLGSGNDYTLRLELSGHSVPGDPVGQSGSVQTPDGIDGRCYGNYEINSREGQVYLAIEFFSTGRGGGCNNESLTIKIARENYDRIFANETVPVTYYSKRFYMGARESTLSLIDP